VVHNQGEHPPCTSTVQWAADDTFAFEHAPELGTRKFWTSSRTSAQATHDVLEAVQQMGRNNLDYCFMVGSSGR